MALYYLAGEQLNVLEVAASVTSTSEDSDFPLTNLYQSPGLNRPSQPFRFGAVAADLVITADLNRVSNPGFETGTLDDWTANNSGTGSTAQEAVIVNSGSVALKCSGGAAGIGSRYQDITVRAGERLQIDGYLRGDGTASARLRVQNLHTGHYCDAAGDWGSADDIATESGAAYDQKQVALQMESLEACGWRSLVTLRIHCLVSENGDGYFDDVELYPAINMLSVHGHNLTPVVTPQLRSSTDAFVGVDDLEATLTIYRPSFYTLLSTAKYRPDWRLKLSGTPVEIPVLGQVVLGYAEEATQPQDWGFALTDQMPEVRTRAPGGDIFCGRLSDDALRRLRMSFGHPGLDEFRELRDGIWRRGFGGEVPCVIVPYHADAEVAILGHVLSSFEAQRRGVNVTDHDLVIDESGFAVVGL